MLVVYRISGYPAIRIQALCSGRPRLQRSPGRLPGTHERLHVSECPIVLFQRVAEVCDGAALVRHTAATPYSLAYSCMAPYRCHALSRLPPVAIQPYSTIQRCMSIQPYSTIHHTAHTAPLRRAHSWTRVLRLATRVVRLSPYSGYPSEASYRLLPREGDKQVVSVRR